MLNRRKCLALVTSVLAASMLFASGAYAKSSTTGAAGNNPTSGKVTIGNESAWGQTTCGGGNCSSYVEVTYYYKHGDASQTRTVTKSNYSPSFGASVTASAEYVPAKSIRATAYHKAEVGTARWSDNTWIDY
ncbi:hypothetical protein HFN20_15660 [Paenibacillus dendritiformis]|uniref:hypothetical protein n=1 Tax=Paenibacillus dendritiformis TaxID=130049 RepID=UPI00143DFC58|nr:hypothetical protein [Paenibacillus dendritiformis]NKI22637.1 hypothetical protein [Paenibacillus dendritiformis]NRF96623.1 hypothetical protein [Paenibacillus dendritiformis]